MQTKRTRILLADDHQLFRKSLRSLLAARPELEICGEALDGFDAFEKTKQLSPDIIVMDVTMPRIDGLQATRMIRNEAPSCKVLVLSQHDSPHMLAAAFKAGASAYVTKSEVAQSLLEVIESLIRGESFHWNSHRAAPDVRGSALGPSRI